MAQDNKRSYAYMQRLDCCPSDLGKVPIDIPIAIQVLGHYIRGAGDFAG